MMPNKAYIYLLILTTILFCSTGSVMADSTGLVKFNLDNGLPTNHVYRAFIDRAGYMWLATDNGVIKYDGYSFKIFNTANGLPSNDVWEFFEDGMARLWLSMYAYEFGYIKNDKYHRVLTSNRQYLKLVYMNSYGSTTFLRGSALEQSFSVDATDKISQILHSGYISNKYTFWGNNDSLSIYDLKGNLIKRKKYPGTQGEGMYVRGDSIIVDELSSMRIANIYHISRDSMYRLHKVFEKDEKPILHFFNGNVNFITNKYWYVIYLKDKAVYTRTDFRKLLNDREIQMSYVTYDALHNMWMGSNKGLFFKNKTSDIGQISTPVNQLNRYRHAGYTYSGKTVWWDKDDQTAILTSDDNIILRSPPMAHWEGTTIGSDTALYFETASNIVKWDTRKNTADTLLTLKSDLTGFSITKQSFFWHNLTSIRIRDLFFESATSGVHYSYIGRDSAHRTLIMEGRFSKVLYDTVNTLLWYYNKDAICILNPVNYRYASIDKTMIDILELNTINSLNIDRFGNLFIHHADKLSIYNTKSKQLKTIATNIKLTNAFTRITSDHLLIASESGIAIASIIGPLHIGPVHTVLNPKDLRYKQVRDLVINGNNIILQTDRGSFITTIDKLLNADHIDVSDRHIMQLVVHTPDAYNLDKTDSVTIGDSIEQIRLDMINFYGKGTKNYFYNIDNTGWISAPTGEIFFPRLEPGRHTIRCYATDELWRSNVSTFDIYKQPYWYQTTKWKTIFWISGVILFLGVVLISVLITRYLVQRANDKKRQTLELELRAIHSQINPHFIFNTLGTALYFISKRKLDEAYQHVHKFSRLLRSYLKASHDRYTLLSEEIEMLRNYIELQQIRFEEKVDYNIEIDNKIPAGSIMVPSLLFQPLVENSINHGLFHLEDGRKGKLDISFRMGRDNNEIVCIIEDNGIGRQKAKELREQSELKRDSYGTKLTQDLIDIFKEYESMDIYIEYTDKEAPETGTIVTLTIRNLKYIA